MLKHWQKLTTKKRVWIVLDSLFGGVALYAFLLAGFILTGGQ